MSADYQYMARALRLAARGLNTTHPNPRVGCVIVKNGRIVGSGWHEKAGEPHAEIHALREAGANAAGATAYVTLEPCSHQGRTPPCTEALIRAGINRVVCALVDPNPAVNGGGVKRLREAGVEVLGGIMAAQARELNAGFLQRMQQHRPRVRIKLAQSLDGHIALANGSSQWISGPEARHDVQLWRARSDAILTGIGTVLADDPSLNVRLESTADPVCQPLRVVVDSHWRTPVDCRLLGIPGAVLIAGLDRPAPPAGLVGGIAECGIFPAIGGRVDLGELLLELGRRGMNEVQVEAGATLCGELLQRQLVDEILIYQAPVLLGGGAISPFAAPRLDNMAARIHLKWLDSRRIGNDQRFRLEPVYHGR